MNALECRTLTVTWKHDSCMCMYSVAHCVYISGVLTTYPAPEQGSGILFSSESVHDLGVGGTHLAMSLHIN